MLEKIKQLFTFNKKTEEPPIPKDIVICVHGFGVHQEHEYDNFILFNNNKFNFKTFNIFNRNDENDNNPTIWIRRCESMVESYIKSGYRVSLIGFSMGGVIATHLASKFTIEKLFLVAPAFEYFNVSNVVNTAVKMVKKPPETAKPPLPSNFTSTFMEVVRLCKNDIVHVNCPVCFIHGDKDETISVKSSINAYHKIKHKKKKLFIIHEGLHHMMSEQATTWETWQIFNLFMDEKILGALPTQYAKDIFAKQNEKATD